MPRVGFEPTIPVFERAKTFYALDRAATVIISRNATQLKEIEGLNFSTYEGTSHLQAEIHTSCIIFEPCCRIPNCNRNSKFYLTLINIRKTERFRNRICFRPQVKDPLKRANSSHLRTETGPVCETLFSSF
jgi:hypothetical protein